MPSIDVAMARSVRGGVWGSVVSSLAANIESRGITDTVNNAGAQINDVRTAFSSWDNCMAATYCKWPVIGVMIVGGLIIFSICCGNCCGCCDTPKGTPHKHLDEPYGPTNQGYKSQAPMAPFYNGASTHAAHSTAPTASGASAPPQYADFEVSKSGSNAADADSLPAMPSWEGAGSKKVAIEEEVELEQMKPATSPNPNGQNMPLMAPNAMSHPNSPMPGDRSPYGQNAQTGASGYFPNTNQSAGPYAMGGQEPNGYNGAYGQSTSSFGVDQGYGAGAGGMAAAGGMAMAQGGRPPYRDFNSGGYGQQRGQTYPPPQQEFDQGYGDHEQGGYGMGRPPRNGPSPAPLPRSLTAPPRNGPSPAPPSFRRSPGPPSDYRGSPAPPNDYRRSPAPPAEYRRSPAPQNDHGYDQKDQHVGDNYGRPQYGGGARQYSSESVRPLALQRSYTAEPVSPNLQNNAGFDFSGNSRPQQYNYNRGPGGGPPQHVEEEEEQRPPQSSGGTYPGYKAYQPTKDGWSGV
ncbi:hypothetical protein CSUB01_00343 [Colletotrichum sublineola]|uniref:Fibroin-3 related protein n=1 Tax=Colletotrichum sublineola TaxID=1173701 RepID=A0A066WY38_COLSU|nr:hypothetical protein CSUB01_00343 [Colletotrichum sublineola]